MHCHRTVRRAFSALVTTVFTISSLVAVPAASASPRPDNTAKSVERKAARGHRGGPAGAPSRSQGYRLVSRHRGEGVARRSPALRRADAAQASRLGEAVSTAARRAARRAGRAVAVVADAWAVLPGPASVMGREAGTGAVGAPTPGSEAVKFALAQVGKPYEWGATGPGAYDCSGLALASWRTAGVGLPRTAAAQYYAGPHVSLDQLQPGDLVFWASDPSDPATIYHVAISLGGNETVQATHSGSTVKVMPLWQQDLVPMATVP